MGAAVPPHPISPKTMIRNPTGQSIQKQLVEETILGLRSADKLFQKKRDTYSLLHGCPSVGG